MMPASAGEPAFRVDADFPGGNIVVERVEGDQVFLRQDVRDTQGDWFWWCFRVRGAAGRTLRFQFTRGDVIGVCGPAVSADGGRTWVWLGRAAVKGTAFPYVFPADADEVRFGFAVPYTEADLKAFLQRHSRTEHLKAETLCKSRKGRDVELLRVGRLDGEPDHRVVLTARHHCCESMASFALEGLLDAILAADADGVWFRRHVECLVVPFADKDGVEAGDQGKNRRPRDHNRDYAGESLYPEVAAIRRLVPAWAGGRLRVALDLHCPHIRGPYNEFIYFVGTPDAANWERVQRFAALLEATRTGPLPYSAKNNLPYGQGWNTAKNYGGGKSFSRWAGEVPGLWAATSLEIPYANASGEVVTPDTARAFGRDLARALRRFLEEKNREGTADERR
jgi:predicted deacylase